MAATESVFAGVSGNAVMMLAKAHPHYPGIFVATLLGTDMKYLSWLTLISCSAFGPGYQPAL